MNNELHLSEDSDDGSSPSTPEDGTIKGNSEEEKSTCANDSKGSTSKFTCDVCDKAYRHKSDMLRHRRSHVESVVKCSQCPASFPTEMSLKKHAAAKHSNESRDFGDHFLAQLVLPGSNADSEDPPSPEPKYENKAAADAAKGYPCSPCGLRFRDKRALDRHNKMHTDVEKLKGYPCNQCEERFRDKRALERHIRQHSKPYMCIQCRARFSTDELLKEHESKHEDLKQYNCEKCKQVYSSARNLKRHMQINHSSVKQLSCPVCRKDFLSDQDLTAHMKKHEETTCNQCTAVFDTEEELRSHVCTMQCHFCMELFASKTALEDHMLNLHAAELEEERSDDYRMDGDDDFEDDDDDDDDDDEDDDDDSNDMRFEPKLSIVEDSVDNMEIADDDDNDEDEDMVRTPEDVNSEEGSDMENGINDFDTSPQDDTPLCIACGTSFHTTKDLKIHMVEHARKRSFGCLKCNKNFTTMTNLRRHLQHHEKNTCKRCGLFFIHAKSLEIHDCGYTPHCNICNRPFNSKREYRLHMSTHGIIEEEDKNECYKCADCGKTFAKFMNFRAHRANHTGEKPFVCRDCSEGFLSATALRIHRRSHTGKTYFSCPLCDATFVYEFKLRQHMLTHKTDEEMPFHCPHCQQGFVAKSGLLRHEVVCQSQSSEVNKEESAEAMRRQRMYNRSKVGKNPNKKCHECGETFLRYDQFLLHMRTHNDKAELPLQCSYCPKGFVHEYNRKQHERFCSKRSAEEREERLEKERDYNLYKTFKGQKVFKCPECKQMFRYRHKFVLHQETHKSDGEKKYHCSLCGGGFVSRSGLKRHGMHCEKRSQLERGQRQEKKKQKASMLKHSRSRSKGEEKSLWCADCGGGFTDKQELANHRLSCVRAMISGKKKVVTKTALKDFKCPICTRVFHFAHILKLHMDAHNGIFPYQCKMCSRGFTLKSSYLLHKCLKGSESGERDGEGTSLDYMDAEMQMDPAIKQEPLDEEA
ncbi:zinc finger protein 14-like [Frankliniella occidentalis]|uniref:Zinc finger protein 14-like n=1 Tax=Frankliniella occidentalis TaxID=133901 RepID=A0A6J1SWA6_FRAOC|nr:zinc finger protein 14-like [Frankliniella occidentalis]